MGDEDACREPLLLGGFLDTGPLVAVLDGSEKFHRWTVERVKELGPPLLVCEPVLTETRYLVSALPHAQDEVYRLLETQALRISFCIDDHRPQLHALQRKYRDRPMSPADACLVRLAELFDDHAVLTLDPDFAVYRKHGRRPIEVICPKAD